MNSSLPNGIGLIFFDQLITQYGLIDGNITIIITFTSIFLSQVELFFFGFNMSGTNGWDEAPPEFYDTIVYDYDANSITLKIEAWGPKGVISAFAYIDTTLIPGYEP